MQSEIGSKAVASKRFCAAVAFATALGVQPICADAAMTAAGTSIPNTASVIYHQDNVDHQVSSNVATVDVEEELGIRLEWAPHPTMTFSEGSTSRVPVVLTNAGNGREAFILDGSILGIEGAVTGFEIAGSGSDPDAANIARGGQTVELSPGQALHLMVLVRSGAVGQGTLNVLARAVTGSGKPGTSFPKMGDGGCTAVVGPTTAAASLSAPVRVAGGGGSEPVVTLSKAQLVEAPDGTANAVHGAKITYRLVARVSGAGSIQQAVVTDPVPSGTDYVPGSLTLDGAGVPDAGNLDPSGLAVPLGALASGQARTITFQVQIQ